MRKPWLCRTSGRGCGRDQGLDHLHGRIEGGRKPRLSLKRNRTTDVINVIVVRFGWRGLIAGFGQLI